MASHTIEPICVSVVSGSAHAQFVGNLTSANVCPTTAVSVAGAV